MTVEFKLTTLDTILQFVFVNRVATDLWTVNSVSCLSKLWPKPNIKALEKTKRIIFQLQYSVSTNYEANHHNGTLIPTHNNYVLKTIDDLQFKCD